MIKNWKKEKEWTIQGQWAVRYYNSISMLQLQVSKYREADDFDKAMKKDYDWHGKWYVNIWNSDKQKTKLFTSKRDAVAFASNYMKNNPKGWFK